MLQAYPIKAEEQRVSGRAVVRGAIDKDGAVGQCRVVSEEPVGVDFGFVACAIAGRAKSKLGPADAGRGVVLPFNFNFESSAKAKQLSSADTGEDLDLPLETPDAWTPDDVVFQHVPTPNEFVAHYPRDAIRIDASGIALIACRVRASGRVLCRSMAEAPLGYGFGPAAKKMFEDVLVVGSTTKSGAPAEGHVFKTWVHFTIIER